MRIGSVSKKGSRENRLIGSAHTPKGEGYELSRFADSLSLDRRPGSVKSRDNGMTNSGE